VPAEPFAVAVALADKIDQLAAFFAVGEVPTGSGDPFALRRGALGVIRIIRDNGLRLPLAGIFEAAGQDLPAPVPVASLLAFIADRLRVQLRADGARHDVLAAVFAAGADDDIVRLLARTDAVAEFLATPDGADLLSASRRAANILRIEDKRDGPHAGPVDDGLLSQPEERALAAALDVAEPLVRQSIEAERYADAMRALAGLRPPLDAFFDKVTVNAPDPALRRNRLRLLARVGAAMGRAADFSRIEGQEKA
jgi:glycyl-tRNA synthetase beta chain